MSTTLKLTQDLRRRAARLAGHAGQSPHAFMVSAIRQQIELGEKRREFVEGALAARREYDRTGEYYDWADVRDYHRARLRGEKAQRPRLRKNK